MLGFDATPLIYLATIHRLDLVDPLGVDCVVPEAVYEEVVTIGIEAGHPGARRIERAVERGTLDVIAVDASDLPDRLMSNPNLSDADAAVIALAATRDAVAVMDERYGRATAATEGVETRGTIWLLLSLVRDDRLPADEARVVVDAMIDAGWYCATDRYTRIVRRLEAMA